MAIEIETSRSVAGVVNTVRQLEGGGFVVRRPFPTQTLAHADPFMLLDHMGPADYGPGEAVGAPDHPHRGFETVTYMLEGAFEHKDSQGHQGRLGPADVQWMTAGSGIVHSEMPAQEIMRDGGRVNGFQLWVNLPAKDKMIHPRYQEIPGAGIPVARSDDGRVSVRVIAGEALGARAVIDTRTPIVYLHFTLQPGGRVSQLVPAGYNAFGYVIRGEGRFGPEGRMANEGQAVFFRNDGNTIELSSSEDAPQPLSLLLLAGQPLNEPIARYGPFVMNTKEEIYQAIADYQAGRMGVIPATLG